VDELADELIGADGPVPLARRMRRFAFAVIATTVLGLNSESREALFADFEIWTKALFSIPLAIPGTPFAKAMGARQRLLNRIKEVLKEGSNQGGLDLLSGGLDEGGIPLDDDDLAEQLLLLLFAGYETTTSSLSCLFRALLLHPEVMEWLRSDVMASPWPASTSPQSDKLDATVLEVMRQTPPVGGFFRRSLHAIELADVAVPKNSVIQVALTPTAATSGTDLSEFRPQRHRDGSFDQTLLPFGGGERVCLGKALAELEIRLMAVGLLQKVQLQLVPDQDLALQLVPSPTPRSGLMVTATGR
jgi:cytochrome P450